jgi:hypothetical protein
MSLVTLNNQGIKVLATNPFFYSYLDGGQYVVCCGEYQDVLYCFKSNTKQGCAFCDFDPSSECECEACQE